MGAQLGSQMSYVGISQGGGSMQQPLEQNVILQGGPRSAGPGSGTPADWNLSQQALMVSQIIGSLSTFNKYVNSKHFQS